MLRTRRAGAEAVLARALEIERRLPSPDAIVVADALSGLAMMHSNGQDPTLFTRADAEWDSAFAAYATAGAAGAGPMRAYFNYARMKVRLGEQEAALRAFERGLTMMRAAPELPAEAPFALEDYGDALINLQRWAGADSAYREAIAARGAALDYSLPGTWSKLGTTLLERGEAAEALALYRTAVHTRLRYLAQIQPDEPRFAAFARRVAERGYEPADVAPLGELLHRRAPDIVGRLRHTTLQMARAEQALGHAARAQGYRDGVEALDRLTAALP